MVCGRSSSAGGAADPLALVRARAHTFDYVGWLLEIAAQLAYFGSITVSTMLDVTLLRDSILGSTKALIRLKTF